MGRWVRGSEWNERRKGKGGTVGYQAFKLKNGSRLKPAIF